MSNPLCPSLYKRLEERFGSVIIANEGEGMVTARSSARMMESRTVQGGALSQRGATTRGRVEVLHRGESYRVCCPKCGDTRHRLWINHRMVEFPGLTICFNAGCYRSREAREQLVFYLYHTRAPKVPLFRKGDTDSGKLSKTV